MGKIVHIVEDKEGKEEQVGIGITIREVGPFDMYGYQWIGVNVYNDGSISYDGKKAGDRISREDILKLITATIEQTMKNLEMLKRSLQIVENSNNEYYQ